MPTLKLTQVIKRPVEEVFGTVADGANFHKWNPTIRSARKVSEGGTVSGSTFEWDLRGFGKVHQEVQAFRQNKQIRFVPHIKSLEGGHRFIFTGLGNETRIDHELEMIPKGLFKLFSPFMGMMGRKNLRDTANALQRYLERT